MPLELLNSGVLICGCDRLVLRVGCYDISSFLEFVRPLDAVNLNLTADAFCALSPFKFDGIKVVFF
jgi:hypothetical protein